MGEVTEIGERSLQASINAKVKMLLHKDQSTMVKVQWDWHVFTSWEVR